MSRGENAGRGRREEVLLAAAKVFCGRGYRASTIQDVARELGFTSAALYYYFDSKEMMLNEIIMRPMQLLIDEADAVAATPVDQEMDRIRDLVRRHVTLILAEYELFSILLRERLELSDEAAAQLRELEEGYYVRIRGLVEACVQADEADVRSPRLAALALIGMMNWVLRWYTRDGELTPDEIAEAFFEVFVHGITSGARVPAEPGKGSSSV